MTEQIDVDDFLAHYGVPGMRWGKRNSSSDVGDSVGGRSNPGGSEQLKPKMSREKKIAIAVGVGATLAIGAAVTIAVLNGKKMDLPVQSLSTHSSAMKGKASLIFGAAAQNAKQAREEVKPSPVVVKQLTAKAVKQVNEAAQTAGPGKTPLGAKIKEAAINKAKDMAYERAKEQAMDKAKEFAINKAKSMLRPASTIPQQPAVVFNPQTGLYEEVPQPQAA